MSPESEVESEILARKSLRILRTTEFTGKYLKAQKSDSSPSSSNSVFSVVLSASVVPNA
jgi:hypothetical protein